MLQYYWQPDRCVLWRNSAVGVIWFWAIYSTLHRKWQSSCTWESDAALSDLAAEPILSNRTGDSQVPDILRHSGSDRQTLRWIDSAGARSFIGCWYWYWIWYWRINSISIWYWSVNQ